MSNGIDNAWDEMKQIVSADDREGFERFMRKIFEEAAKAGANRIIQDTFKQSREQGLDVRVIVDGKEAVVDGDELVMDGNSFVTNG